MLYSETDLENSLSKISLINFHEEKEVGGIKFWCYHAGHVLGAAMFMIQIAGIKVQPGSFYATATKLKSLLCSSFPESRSDCKYKLLLPGALKKFYSS